MFHEYHEISASTNEICIYGYKNNKPSSVTIQHNCREWTTLLLEYRNLDNVIRGTFIINDDPTTLGEYSFQTPFLCYVGLYIGSRHDNTKFLTGAIHAIESYFRPGKETLIIENQMISGI